MAGDEKAPKGLASAAKPAEKADNTTADMEGFDYNVILHGGAVIKVVSKLDPVKLAANWAKARKTDDVVAWNGDQFTEARQVAHIESVLEEDDDEDGENEEAEGDAGDGAQAGAGGGEGGEAKPAGLAAAAGVANG